MHCWSNGKICVCLHVSIWKLWFPNTLYRLLLIKAKFVVSFWFTYLSNWSFEVSCRFHRVTKLCYRISQLLPMYDLILTWFSWYAYLLCIHFVHFDKWVADFNLWPLIVQTFWINVSFIEVSLSVALFIIVYEVRR